MADPAYKLYIFDVAGTLIRPRKSRLQKTASDWHMLPGRVERIQKILSLRPKPRIALASNMGGIARGIFSMNDGLREIQKIAALIGAEHFEVCGTNPTSPIKALRVKHDFRRKPNPGMLLELMQRFTCLPEDTLLVSEDEKDWEAAKNAGCHFISSNEFFA